MNTPLRQAFDREWLAAHDARRHGDLALAFHHLERAHILSQRDTWRHTRTHVAMWRIGWLRRDLRELTGQTARTLAALLCSRIWVPVGNTGGANVSALRPMAVPTDLAAVLAASPAPADRW